MIEQQIAIPTKDGHTATFIVHPERGGPFPVILFYMDAPAIREELRDMARRLATSGYYVMLPNLYYRSGVMELGALPADPNAPERKRMFQLMASLNIPNDHGRHQGTADLRRGPDGGEHEDHRRRRLLHERPLRRQRRHAFPRSRQGCRVGLRDAAGNRSRTTARISQQARPRPSSISPAPRPTSTRRRR